MVHDPNIAVLLVLAGALGVYLELCRPGWIVPGVAGGVAALVGLASLTQAQGAVSWPVAVLVTLPFAVVTAILLRIALRARRNKRL